MDAVKSGDPVAEVRAEGAVRTLYQDIQMRVYRGEKSWTQHEEMQLQEIIEEEANKLIEIYRISAQGEELDNYSDEELLKLLDSFIDMEPL